MKAFNNGNKTAESSAGSAVSELQETKVRSSLSCVDGALGAASTHDENLATRVARFLEEREVSGYEHVEVCVERPGVVTLRGQVPSADARRLCVQCTRYVAGVSMVVDELVSPPVRIGGNNTPPQPFARPRNAK